LIQVLVGEEARVSHIHSSIVNATQAHDVHIRASFAFWVELGLLYLLLLALALLLGLGLFFVLVWTSFLLVVKEQSC